jgi:hypothetical protein
MVTGSCDVASIRARLWAAGFRPVAVYSAASGVIGAGKRPRGDSWQQRARTNPPAAVTERPERVALNTGILSDALRAIDLDIDRPGLAAKVREIASQMLGPTLERSRSNSSRSLFLYRAADGSPGKIVVRGALGTIEILGRGQQFVAHGTHPSGSAFIWSPAAPGAVTREALPAVSENQIAAFVRAASPLIGAQQPTRLRRRAPNGIFADTRALACLVRLVASACEGDCNNLAFWAACRAGEMVAAGLFDAETAEAVIADAAMRTGIPAAEAERTARSGVITGSGAQHA